MRQIIASVPRGQGERALEMAQAEGGMNLLRFPAEGVQGARDMLLVQIPNERVESLTQKLQEIEDLQINFAPQGIIALRPPASAAPDQVVDVGHRSPIEIFLGGLQSVGSWKGFLGYSFSAGVVAWIGLHTNTVFLLTASMLIAPFAGPAMTLALGTSRGDAELIGRSLLRYFSGIAVAIIIAWALSMVTGQALATELMVQMSLLSSVTVLLPITAGAAGALNLCQSERNSLVTAAGPGVLVAASLAPPATVIGMASAIGEWGMVKREFFVLFLQLVGINFSGAVVFWLFGLTPRGVRYDRGNNWLRWCSVAVSAAGVALLLIWQFWNQPELQRSTREQRISRLVQKVTEESALATVVESRARFPLPRRGEKNTVLVTVYVEPSDQEAKSKEAVEKELSEALSRRIAEEFNVDPFVEVTALNGFKGR